MDLVKSNDDIQFGFARFLDTHQNPNEKASEYLQRTEYCCEDKSSEPVCCKPPASDTVQTWLLGPHTCHAVGAET